jgi:hypothetical protein
MTGVAMVLHAAAAEGQEATGRATAGDAAADARPRRVVGGHAFIVSPLVSAPLATTYVSTRTIIGVAEGEGDVFNPLVEDIGNADYDLATMSEQIDLQIAPTSWLAFRAGIGGSVFGALNAEAALALGATVRYAPSFGVAASVPFGDRLRAGVSLDYAFSNRTNLNIVRPIADSIEAERLITKSLIVDDRVSIFVPGVNAALALGRAVGVVASAQYRREEGGDDLPGLSPKNAIGGGLAIDVDLAAVTPAPVGLLLAYRLTEPLGEEDVVRTQELDFGVYYTGRPELELGIELGLRRFPLIEDVPADAALSALVLRYHW